MVLEKETSIVNMDNNISEKFQRVDTAIQEANAKAAEKSRVFYTNVQPSASAYPGYTFKNGDVWYNTSNGADYAMSVYNNGSWVLSQYGGSAIQELAITNAHIHDVDAGRMRTGTLEAILIKRNSNNYWNLGSEDIEIGDDTYKAGMLKITDGQILASKGEFTTGFKVDAPVTGDTTGNNKIVIETGVEQSVPYTRMGFSSNSDFNGLYINRSEASLHSKKDLYLTSVDTLQTSCGTGANSAAITMYDGGVNISGPRQVGIVSTNTVNIIGTDGVTINGFQLLKTVPANALFTDTIVPAFTSAANSDIADKSVASGTDWVNLGNFTLAAGYWIVYVRVRFGTNGTGRRAINLSGSSGGDSLTVAAADIRAAVPGGNTFCSLVYFLHTTASTKYYVNCYQNSGATLTVTTRYGAWKLRNA